LVLDIDLDSATTWVPIAPPWRELNYSKKITNLVVDDGSQIFSQSVKILAWRVQNPMMALDTVDVKRQVRVMMIDGGRRVRAHLNTLGIHIGDWLTVVERAPFRGPVLVEINGTRVALGRGIAAKIRVDVDGELQPLVRRPPEIEAE
jgi:ferrous iron transport protein A